ncbi:MAG TPA: hypothetical protein VFA45_03685 [Actinomycetes bacterium]|nr:hypothetical protein [Actinomycetes bacterium]
MDGFLDLSSGGRTELRVHGVSGTPPEATLCHPHPRQVAGDGVAGFYRRWWPGGSPTGEDRDVEAHSHREAYSWGGLTSGAASRALWLLLLPFMLLNFAFYMTPRPPVQDGGSRLRRASAGAQRLLALTFTGSLVLSAVGVAMDLVGWQCGRPGSRCASQHGWLGFLGWNWLDGPARQLAVTSLVPAAVVGLLWYLGRSTWVAHELTRVPGRTSEVASGPEAVLLEDRRTWNGSGPVGRLRAAHVATAFSVVGMSLLAPLARDSGPARGLLVVHLVVLAAAAAIVTAWSQLAQRDRPPEESADEAEPSRRRRAWPADQVAAAGAALYLLSFLLAFFAQPDPGRGASGALPWFEATIVWTFLVQGGVLVVLLALTALICRSTRRRQHDPAQTPPLHAWTPAPDHHGRALPVAWGMVGLGTPVVTMLAWLLAGGFGAGLALRAAGFLGTPAAAAGQAGRPGNALVVPTPYFWMAALTLVVLAAVVVAGLWLLLRWRGFRRQEFQQLRSRQGASTAPELITPDERARKARLLHVAGTWARARLTDEAGPVVGSLLIAIAVLLVAGCALYGWLGPTWLPRKASWLVTAGSFAVGALALWLIAMGRNAYRSSGRRRTVGILWDVGTFWPRAVHPLAPPCYTERIIPDLLERVRWLAPTDDDVVVVSAHSQGTIIAAALVLQLEPEERRRVRLLTYGSPLQRVYARYFPAYFGAVPLLRIGQVLPPRQVTGQAAGTGATGATWSWRNLFRPSDPIGGAVFYAYAVSTEDNGDVDWQLMDPAIYPAAGDRAWPRTYGHSDYFRDPAFTAALRLLAGHAPEVLDEAATLAHDAQAATGDHPVLSSDATG